MEMDSRPVLSRDLRGLVETRMRKTLEGIEKTLQHILEHEKLDLEELKVSIQGLEESFNLLSQKWNLQILYILFLRNAVGFGEMKRILGANSRTLSDKLKALDQYEYVERSVEQGPPLRVRYSLTRRGWNTILLALPLLYYSSTNLE